MRSDNRLRTLKIIMLAMMLLLMMPSALGLGVAPSRKVLTYEAGEVEVQAKIVNNDAKDMRVLIMPQGNLGKYVSLDDNIVRVSSEEEEKTITYRIRMNDTFMPGENMIRVALIELPDEFKDQVVLADGQIVDVENNEVTATTAIVQQVIVNVPYPEEYAKGKLYVTGNKVGEEVKFSISLFNMGEEDIDVRGYIIVKGPTNEEVAKIDAGTVKVKGMKESRLVGTWTGTEHAGEYLVDAHVTYGDKSFKLSQKFNLGHPQISIESLNVKSFRLGSIAKFDVSVLSRWNKQIKEVEGEMRVLDKEGGVLSSFETTRTDIPAHGMKTISGYWDTEGVQIGEYDVNVMLEYEGRSSQKLFETVVSIDDIQVKEPVGTVGQALGSDEEGGQYTLLIILVLVLVVLNIFIFMYFRKLKGWLQRPPGGAS